MAWVKLDENFPDHPKVARVGPVAAWLYVCGLAYCNRLLTDGFIPTGQLRKLADVDEPECLADRLVEAELWEMAPGGYRVHDYLEYQPSKDHAAALSEARAAAGMAGGKQRASNLLERRLADASSKRVAKSKPVPGPVTVPESVPVTEVESHPTQAPAREGEAVASATPTREPKYPPAFIAFWTAYPRKENKPEALKAWLKLHPDGEMADAILAGVATWQASDQWARKMFQHASTWLNGRQWEDEPMAASEAAPARGSPNGHKPSKLEIIRAGLGLAPGGSIDRNGAETGDGGPVYDVAASRSRRGDGDAAHRALPGSP